MTVHSTANSAFDALLAAIQAAGGGTIGLVAGNRSFETSGAAGWLRPLAQTHPFVHLRTRSSEATTDVLAGLLDACRGARVDLLLAVGGGHVIDAAKLLSLFLANPPAGDLVSALRAPVAPANPVIPLIAVPLTAGTGSEVTPYAVVYHDGVKCSVESPALVPFRALHVAPFLKSLSPRQRAQTALDAFSQAIEAYWNVNSTPVSDRAAEAALAQLTVHFADYVGGGNRDACLAAMHEASCRAGEAIAVTRTTAPHALSYPLTGFYGVPHGIAVALTLGEFFAYNEQVRADDCSDPRGPAYVRGRMQALFRLLRVDDAPGARRRWHDWLRAGGIGASLAEHNIGTAEALARILDHGFAPERMRNNPRIVTREWASGMLQRIWKGAA
jgi:alcohol dehydrogenase